jgi:selenocysteine-specific elongation factor
MNIPELLGGEVAGLSLDVLASKLPGIGATLLEEALTQLLGSHAIAKDGNQLFVPRLDEVVARARGEAAVDSQVADVLRRGGLTPPMPREIVTSVAIKRAIDRLLRVGLIVRGYDQANRRDILFHQEAIHDAKHRLAPLLAHGPGLLATEIGAALGISRKYSLPLLYHLDAIGFTRRVNDRRIRGA